MLHGTAEIDPTRLYSLSEAASFIPSPRQGKKTHLVTLHRWRREGRLPCECRQMGGRRFYFVWGSVLLRLLHADTCPEWNGRTPDERERAVIAAEKRRAEIAPRTQRRRRNDAQHEPTPRPTGRPRRPRHDQSERPPGPGV